MGNRNRKILVSICIPVLNEDENIFPLYQRLNQALDSIRHEYSFEFIFTDNNSDDLTWKRIVSLGQDDKNVKGIRFTRNIGFQESILTNFSYSKGRCLVQIDADLQDPPELIVEFLREWRAGNKVVYGIRKSRQENFVMNILRRFGYRVISFLSEHSIPVDAGDFRLIDRTVAERLLHSKSPKPYIRGMIASFGFPSKGIEYIREMRNANESKFPLRKIFDLGKSAIFNHSSWPLRLATVTGWWTLFFSIVLALYYLILRLLNHELPQGLASIHILVLFGISFNALFLGVVGNYINQIHTILRNESRITIEDSVNVSEKA
jgi:dolichol-phosphate mannosyltransferase